MQRLKKKDQLREIAVKMIVYSYKIKKTRNMVINSDRDIQIREYKLKYLLRSKKQYIQQFGKLYREIKNVGDSAANTENLKNGIE